MTAIKQIAVTSGAHLKSLRGYLDRSNERHEVLDMDSQHLDNPANWEREFDRTREAYGHNRPGKTGSRCTYLYHQVIAMNPSECDLNGGKMSAGDCMRFAREWVERYYPNQEAVWALHREHCAADGTDRYAVHVAINRSDLVTGKRLDEGRASRQRTLHAKRMRDMDERWGLAQMERGVRNSAVHARQPSRAEQRAREAGMAADPDFKTDLDRVREAVRESVAEVSAGNEPGNRMRELARSLEAKGIEMHVSADKAHPRRDVVFTYTPSPKSAARGAESRSATRKISGTRLGRGFSLTGIESALGIGRAAARLMEQAAESGMENGDGDALA